MLDRGYRRAAWLAAMAFVSVTGCGRVLTERPSGGAAHDSGTMAAGDASVQDASDDAPAACDFDASPDAEPCAVPYGDILYASPGSIMVAAGGYGTVSFIAEGPWASDPTLTITFEGSTLDLIPVSTGAHYGTPQSLVFQAPPMDYGLTGTVTAVGRAGNLAISAFATVYVTNCTPFPEPVACGTYACGFQSDGCGGVESCGACSVAAPYCYGGQCIANQPHPCPPGDGFVPDSGACAWCGRFCAAIDNTCVCPTSIGPPIPVIDGGLPASDAGGTAECDPVQPFVGDATHVACPVNQRCDFVNSTTTRCSPPAGTGIQDVFCTVNTDCAAGYACIPGATATVWCERYCHYGAGYDDCGTLPSVGEGRRCRELSPPAFDGTQEIGVCDF